MRYIPDWLLSIVATIFWRIDGLRNWLWPEIKRRHPDVFVSTKGGNILVLTDTLRSILRLFEMKNEYGLTEDETRLIVSLAGASTDGYDNAMYLALNGFGLKSRQFDQLLARHGIGRQ